MAVFLNSKVAYIERMLRVGHQHALHSHNSSLIANARICVNSVWLMSTFPLSVSVSTAASGKANHNAGPRLSGDDGRLSD